MMEADDVPLRQNRFKHQSYNDSLKDVHVPSALDLSKFDRDIGDNESHFYEALQQWRQLNLSSGFMLFANRADSLSMSMPLLLHNWKEIFELWANALDDADDEALSPLFDLSQKLIHDLRTTILPIYPDLLQRLLHFLARPIPPSALTALLGTLTALIKYLVVPSSNLDMIDQTWSSLCEVLQQCDVEVQRATSEAWASLLRRLKNTTREKTISLMVSKFQNIEDACARTIVFACKSVSQSLHTATKSIISPLLAHYIVCDNHEIVYTLLRRVFTALIHHCKSADQFSDVVEIVVDQFRSVAQSGRSTSNHDDEPLRRMLFIVSVICSVRRGSRVSTKHISTLISEFSSLPLTPPLYSPLLSFATSILIASDMNVAAGSSRALLARALENPDFASMLFGSLATLGWSGWKLVAQPLILQATPRLFEQKPQVATRLLAALCRENKVSSVDIVWKRCVESWVEERLRTWRKEDDRINELPDLLALWSFIESSPLPLVSIIDSLLDIPDPRKDYQTRPLNAAWALGLTMQALADGSSRSTEKMNITAWARKVADNWAWSHKVLEGFVALLASSSIQFDTLLFSEVYPHLQESLLSHSQALRLNSLRLLSSRLVNPSMALKEVLRRCLQGEECTIDVQGVRERVLWIGRVSQVVQSEPWVVDVCARWLISQLKVNLRPLWHPAIESLSSVGIKSSDEVWNLMFTELRTVSLEQSNIATPSWMINFGHPELNDVAESERSWRDPSAHKLRVATMKWLSSDSQHKIVQDQVAKERFDPQSYELQLLSTMSACSTVAERHNRDLVPLFLSLGGLGTVSHLPKYRLSAWLTLFSKFSNPKALHSTDALYSIYTSLLSHPDRSLQKLSLSCLLTYKSPRIIPYESVFNSLLDDSRWREQLTALDFSLVEPNDRPEFVDVTIRLLFGLMLERKSHSQGVDRRAAILTALGGCADEELTLLADLMLHSMQSHGRARREPHFVIRKPPPEVTHSQQSGFLTLLGDVLKQLGTRMIPCWPALIGSTVDIIAHAQQQLGMTKEVDGTAEGEGFHEEVVETGDLGGLGTLRTARTIRQLGLKRFADFFRLSIFFDFAPFLTSAFQAFISPRLALLNKENTQAPSALLELFYSWCSRMEYARYLVDFDSNVLPKTYECLLATNVKPSVISRVLDIVDQLLLLAEDDSCIREKIVKPHVSLLLGNLAQLVQRTKSDVAISSPLTQRQIGVLSEIAQYVSDGAQALTLLSLITPLLRKPTRVVPEKTKVNLLKILGRLLQLIASNIGQTPSMHHNLYESLSQLFQSLRSGQARATLVATFRAYAAIDKDLQSLADTLASLNAFSANRIDEPDFDRRLTAFAQLNQQHDVTMSIREWLPLLYNMLFFIQDNEELAIRTSASQCLKNFIDILSTSSDPEYTRLFLQVIHPGLKNSLHSRHELVCAEVLGVLSHAIIKCEAVDLLKEMRPLLAGGDEEASFFTNVFHVQIHRRRRALRRLSEYCDEGHLRGGNMREIFIPIVEHYLQSTSSVDHLLVNEAIHATGRMSRHLPWGAYYALVQKYLRYSKIKDEATRINIRTLVAILESFHFEMEEVVHETDSAIQTTQAIMEEQSDPELDQHSFQTKAFDIGRVADAVNSRLMPGLMQFLEKRDEAEDSLRIPLSIGIVNVAKHLPVPAREAQITRLLTIMSQILRSKSQETRDLTREALCKIAVILGPSYLPLILREMRAALLRGPQLHVLAFVTHSLLVHVTVPEHAETFDPLDDCVGHVAHVSAEVIFGQSGKDLQSEGFKTTMREVRSSSSNGLDSFSIMARYVTPSHISALLLPLRSIMQETESLKVMQKVEELLRRITTGFSSNRHLTPPELLVLCHTLITQNARFTQEPVSGPKSVKHHKEQDDAIVQLKRHTTSKANCYATNSFRFVVFGLELFNNAMRRGRFDFHERDIISRLEPLVNAIGNALYANNALVVVSGIKAAAAIVKCPLKSVDKSLSIFILRILEVIKQSGDTDAEVVQTAFKALAAILRDCQAAQIKEKDLVFLLELIAPDLEEVTHQSSAFALLRAIVARKFVVPEMYDLMDKIATILVTSQSIQAQELCRSVLLQFLLDYPQGKGRLRNQMTFLAKNLSYVYESGRKSVMELLNAVVVKFDTGLIREYAELLLVALVMVIANDDSSKCREMAGELFKNLFSRLDQARHRVIMNHIHAWATHQSQVQLQRVSIQVYGLTVDVLHRDIQPFLSSLLDDLHSALSRSQSAEDTLQKDIEDMDMDIEWQTPYHALTVLSKILQIYPEFTIQPAKTPWPQIASHLLFPHAWVRIAACRLFGVLFASAPTVPPGDDSVELEILSRSGMRNVAEKLCLQLRSEHLDEALSLQVTKNLLYIGKCYYAVPHSAEILENNKNEIEDVDEDHEDGSHHNAGQEPLRWLFSKLSYQVRSAHITRRNRSSSSSNWVQQPLAILRWFGAMVSHMDASRLEVYLTHILSPLYRILDDDTVHDISMDELKTVASELQDLLQSKVGTTKFAAIYSRIRQRILSVRHERKTARTLQVTVNPQAAARRKVQRNVVKKESKKRKNQGFAESKGRSKRKREN